ncbi:phage major capsid protein, P2 family [Leptospira sp. 96542]|nr:phage major capsid protein, P2 family [Leptospira sp. 96542]
MRNETRVLFNSYTQRIAELNGVTSAAAKFNASPSVQQTLETLMQDSSEFLTKINIIGVNDQSGEKVGLGVSGTIASRTNTTVNDRQPAAGETTDADAYFCKQTNFDTALKYSMLDAWAKFPDFQTRLRDAILRRQALDRIMIGFNGVQAAAATNKANFPLLQDVNIGWLQKVRTNAAAQVQDEGSGAGNEILVGTGESAEKIDGLDYQNLDAIVRDAATNLLAPWYVDDPDMVVVLGRGLMHQKLFPLFNQNLPTEQKAAADLVRAQMMVGGYQAVTVPFFPANSFAITRLDNLSLYWQIGARRRAIIDNPKRDQIENFESSNDAYVVEDYKCFALVENIEITDVVPGG